MKATELRIDNYFIDTIGAYCEANSIQQVKTILTTGVNSWSDMGASGECRFEQMKPIPLTEQWLKDFGFEFEFFAGTGESVLRIKNVKVAFKNNVFSLGIWNLNFGSFEIKLKYVHQLQNLYFALTGKELIKQ